MRRIRNFMRSKIFFVSIHAPREGCDSCVRYSRCPRGRFNSRTPGGVRRATLLLTAIPGVFQFTHPGRGATAALRAWMPCSRVSIHAPREGCDFSEGCIIERMRGFNSRTPGGVRLLWTLHSRMRLLVSIHAPREGCDSMVQSCLLWGG